MKELTKELAQEAECRPTLTECKRCGNDTNKCDGAFARKEAQEAPDESVLPKVRVWHEVVSTAGVGTGNDRMRRMREDGSTGVDVVRGSAAVGWTKESTEIK